MDDTTLSLAIADGHLHITIDEPEQAPLGTVILAPPYAMSARDMYTPAFALVGNGWRVVRFDGRDHIGSGSGKIVDYRLSTAVADIARVLDEFPDAILVTLSLSARPALRALRGAADVRAAILVTPVVNVRSTLIEVIGRDLLEEAPDLPPGLTVLGQWVGRQFIDDCISEGFDGVMDASEDLETITAPIAFVAGDADPWVDIDDVRSVAKAAAAAGKEVDLVTVRAATHELNRHPAIAMRYVRAIVEECARLAGEDPSRAYVPTFAEVIESFGARTRSIA